MMETDKYLFDLNQDQLKVYFASIGEPPYRVKQLWSAAYTHFAQDFNQVTAFPVRLRSQLASDMHFSHLKTVERFASTDGETIKYLFVLPDGNLIESVLMHYNERHTLCISSQSGCAMGCVFCATGQMGFRRNLSAGEVIEQVLFLGRELSQSGEKITNIVIMGMGEPFHNYDMVLEAIDRLNDPNGLNLGARRFTISTVGIVPGIRRFAAEKRQVNLAISLHAANDALRSMLIPANHKYPLSPLMEACGEYIKLTNRRLTFEWAMIKDVNDSVEHARELAALLKGLLCHVNIIPLNPTTSYNGKATTEERAQEFKQVLENNGIPCTIRARRGIDISAGCGQLAARRA